MITKYDKLEQLEMFYNLSKDKIETEADVDIIIVPFARGDERVEVVYTKNNGDVRTILIHDPQQ